MGMISKLKCAMNLCSHIGNSQAGHSHPKSWMPFVCFIEKRDKIASLNMQLNQISDSKPQQLRWQKEKEKAEIQCIMADTVMGISTKQPKLLGAFLMLYLSIFLVFIYA